MKIISVGSYVPEKIITNNDIEKIVDTTDEWIYTRTGIKERRAVTNETTSDIAIKACKNMLEKNNIDPLSIDVIILSTVTPDYLTPATATIVQDAIGAKNAFSFDISAACTGFIYGLNIASQFLSNKTKRVLLVSAETLSKIIDYDDRGTCVLFGDGAGCVLLEHSEEEFVSELKTEASEYNALTGRKIINQSPFSTEELSDNDKYLKMDGRKIFELVTKVVPKQVKNVMNEADVNQEDISWVIPHQANARIIEVFSKKLKIDLSKFYINLHKYGNTSSASIPIALCELVDEGKLELGSGEKVLITGFGAGFTYGSGILTL